MNASVVEEHEVDAVAAADDPVTSGGKLGAPKMATRATPATDAYAAEGLFVQHEAEQRGRVDAGGIYVSENTIDARQIPPAPDRFADAGSVVRRRARDRFRQRAADSRHHIFVAVAEMTRHARAKQRAAPVDLFVDAMHGDADVERAVEECPRNRVAAAIGRQVAGVHVPDARGKVVDRGPAEDHAEAEHDADVGGRENVGPLDRVAVCGQRELRSQLTGRVRKRVGRPVALAHHLHDVERASSGVDRLDGRREDDRGPRRFRTHAGLIGPGAGGKSDSVSRASIETTSHGHVDSDARAALQQRLLAAPFDPAGLDRAELRSRLASMLREEAPLLAVARADAMLDELVDAVGGLGPLQPLFADPAITEVMVNGPDRVYVERAGRIERVDCAIDATTIVRVVERVIAPLGLRVDRASPMVDARLADGSRLHAVLPPLALDGPCVTIRRFSLQAVPLQSFGLDERASEFMGAIVRGGWNVVVAGATSAGKTTCCNALAAYVDAAERIVTIEETAELALRQPHVVRLEARRANAEGAGAVEVRDLVRAALRMRPDRLIVGEVRGGEALDMLQACNTGHDGSLSTVHANSPADALARLETLALFAGVALPLVAVRAQIASAIDAVVQVARGSEGRREIVAVSEVVAAGRGRAVRPLLVRSGRDLVRSEPPRRAARRGATDLEEVWRACEPPSSQSRV